MTNPQFLIECNNRVAKFPMIARAYHTRKTTYQKKGLEFNMTFEEFMKDVLRSNPSLIR